MIKILFFVFAVALLSSSTYSLCPSGCSCSDDSNCEYYCSGGLCQPQIYQGNPCSGYYIHPRECGSGSYCDPTYRTCQWKKSYNEWCTDDYWCSTGYCSPRTNTCQSKTSSFDWTNTYLIIGISGGSTLLLVLVIIIIVRKQRSRAFAYYQNPYVVLPPNTPYSYQNSYFVGETPPPPYPGVASAPAPKPYQG
jgi:hypothetical protein